MNATRIYFRHRANSIGLKEWKDGFNFDNIPANILDKSYHIESGPVVGIKLNMNDQELNAQVNVRVFQKGFRDPASAIDSCLQLSENFIKECVVPKNRLTGSNGIKNVVFENLSIEQIAATNDNAVIANMQFRVFVILDLI
jgi:hypothetical protein